MMWISRMMGLPVGAVVVAVLVSLAAQDGAAADDAGRLAQPSADAPVSQPADPDTLRKAMEIHRAQFPVDPNSPRVRLAIAHDGRGRAMRDRAGQIIGILENQTDRPIVVRAYANGFEHGQPLFGEVLSTINQTERFDPAGGFQPVFLGWCGTGLMPCTIEPGQSRFIALHAQQPGITRFRLSYESAQRGATAQEAVSFPVNVVESTFDEPVIGSGE